MGDKITYDCPVCEDSMTKVTKNKRQYLLCTGCAETYLIPAGIKPEKRYEIALKQSEHRHPSNTKTLRLADEDEQIEANFQKILKKFSKTPNPVNQVVKSIINSSNHKTVYFKYLKQALPKTRNNLTTVFTNEALVSSLKSRGIKQLYLYQENAINEVKNKKNIIISTPTGTGKTEAFFLGILDTIANDRTYRNPKAILIYPTKALASDQYVKLKTYCLALSLNVMIYDGDTSPEIRQRVLSHPPEILITNPDMIHFHLTSNPSFRQLIKNVRFLVLDEMHMYVGFFGSNLLWIIRRLKRICKSVQLIGASATVENAQEFAQLLFETDVIHITEPGTRKSPLNLTIVYPHTKSAISVASDLVISMLKFNLKVLAFGNSHSYVEALNLILKNQRIKSNVHRAGLLKTHRVRSEKEFKTGKIQTLVASPTLELGIDIGNLDCVITSLVGRTRFIQRIGRTGRKGQESYATLVLNLDDPISAYYARNPKQFLTDYENIYVEPDNEYVAKQQLLTMAWEKPITPDEECKYRKFIEPLKSKGDLQASILGLVPRRKPSKNYSIRGIGDSVRIFHRNKCIGERVYPLAIRELHQGAYYINGGKSYFVTDFDSKKDKVTVDQIKTRFWKTQASRSIFPVILAVNNVQSIKNLKVAYVDLKLTETVDGFTLKNLLTGEILDTQTLETPLKYTYTTKGLIFKAPYPESTVLEYLPKYSETEILEGAYHAFEHVLIESGNFLTGSGANQIGGISMGSTGNIIVYDGAKGGSGLSKLLFDRLEKGISRSLEILRNCPCKRWDGCPKCTFSYQCGNNNSFLSRVAALESFAKVGSCITTFDLEFFSTEPIV